MGTNPSLDELAERVQARVLEQARPRAPRVIVGIAGEPGAGKSTLAAGLVAALVRRGSAAVVVPMDGFQLTNAELARRGLTARKGAIETFDGEGFAELLWRLRGGDGRVGGSMDAVPVRAPAYDRSVEERVVDAITVPSRTPVVVTEGNYLLVEDGPWARVRAALDEAWYVETDDALRRRRLVARHEEFGKEPEAARAWVETVDEPNAALVRSTRRRADVVVTVT